MSLIGGFKYAGMSGSAVTDDTIINFVGFTPSGLTSANALAVCMFKWDATNKMWVPYT